MPKGLLSVVRDNLEKCRSAAIAAVDVYNRPGPRFRTAHYIVLIIIAWTALFHAMFYKKGIKPWYQKRKGANPRGDRYEHVGGDPRCSKKSPVTSAFGCGSRSCSAARRPPKFRFGLIGDQPGLRSDLKVTRRSDTRSAGCSHAAKCPPLGWAL